MRDSMSPEVRDMYSIFIYSLGCELFAFGAEVLTSVIARSIAGVSNRFNELFDV